MSDYKGQYSSAPTVDLAYDEGLRKFMLGVYNKMGLGLVVTGLLAAVVAFVPEVTALFFQRTATGGMGYTPLGMGVAFAPLVILLGAGFVMRNPTTTSTAILYWLIVGLIGLSMGVLGIVYTGQSIATTFFVTAAAFGALSLFGYTTKKDLSGMRTFLLMATIGLIIAVLVNMFLIKSGITQLVISAIGVLIFAGWTAYDTQNLKRTYYALGGNEAGMAMATNYGALSLYIDFINMFQFLLAFMGVRRD
ncbi:Bax inhibitor-1/YccA family protein [Asticcacaulis sp. SL142]|uniref:Bax inhibitor-1/YccA family protein n=1 Tax=Asticcacaulis sp. SL142 TaxID=2995155 RepID=UPI00226CFBC3|nr:Bax inhibitor-1/YccA family protein [Asticcacaulis sp. SL142]WAC46974.1 Bax inhibitor-1/YccA family protein [Asticcacaulis sp. SL142]